MRHLETLRATNEFLLGTSGEGGRGDGLEGDACKQIAKLTTTGV